MENFLLLAVYNMIGYCYVNSRGCGIDRQPVLIVLPNSYRNHTSRLFSSSNGLIGHAW